MSLNERLRERVALRNMSGDNSMPLDEEWENWLKFAIESGELPHVADQIARFPRPYNTLTADDIFPPRTMAAARAGHWDQIPPFLHDMIRHALESSGRTPAETSVPTTSNARPSIRYSNVLGTIPRVTVYATDDRGTLSEFRPPVANGRHSSRSNNRAQQTARPGA